MIAPRRCRRASRGVSLIEALVAFAVLAFGMLGVVGMQATLRYNADIAKQRSEAVRVAQEALEDWRTFSVLNPTPGHASSYAAIASAPQAKVDGYTTNTEYRRTGTVVESVRPANKTVGFDKTLVVDVEWTDRSGVTQSVRLSSLVAGVAPELAATLVSPSGTRSPFGRHRGIPPQAPDFGHGTSGFVPPQPDGGPLVGWLFDNVTGWFTVCTTFVQDNTHLTENDLINCIDNQYYMLLSGYLRYATAPLQPVPADVGDANADGPAFPLPRIYVQQTAPAGHAGPQRCFVSRLKPDPNVPPRPRFRDYYCSIPIDLATPKWSGSVVFTDPPLPDPPLPLAANAADPNPNRFRVCRYFPVAPYVDVKDALFNQNFVVIRAGDGVNPFTCPAGVTWTHQP